jgi:hypothetical protein
LVGISVAHHAIRRLGLMLTGQHEESIRTIAHPGRSVPPEKKARIPGLDARVATTGLPFSGGVSRCSSTARKVCTAWPLPTKASYATMVGVILFGSPRMSY